MHGRLLDTIAEGAWGHLLFQGGLVVPDGRKGTEQTGSQYRDDRYRLAEEYVAGNSVTARNINAEHFAALYLDLKLSYWDVGRLLGRSTTWARSKRQEFRLIGRSNAETRTGHYDTEIFKTWTPEMAWLLGLLFSDGYFHDVLKQRQIRLCLNDTETVEKAARIIGPEFSARPRGLSKSSKIPSFELCFGGGSIFEDLTALGLAQAKSLTMLFPDVPPNYLSHFIRGCWDGDGGISATGATPAAHYTCGSIKFITCLRDMLFDQGIVRKILRKHDPEFEALSERFGAGPYPLRIYKRGQESKAFDLRIGHPESLRRLFDFMYNGSADAIRMSRKYDAFRDALGLA